MRTARKKMAVLFSYFFYMPAQLGRTTMSPFTFVFTPILNLLPSLNGVAHHLLNLYHTVLVQFTAGHLGVHLRSQHPWDTDNTRKKRERKRDRERQRQREKERERQTERQRETEREKKVRRKEGKEREKKTKKEENTSVGDNIGCSWLEPSTWLIVNPV